METSRATKIICIKFLFARPSSLHDEESPIIRWSEDGLPKISRAHAAEVIQDDEQLVALYNEIIARERKLISERGAYDEE